MQCCVTELLASCFAVLCHGKKLVPELKNTSNPLIHLLRNTGRFFCVFFDVSRLPASLLFFLRGASKDLIGHGHQKNKQS